MTATPSPPQSAKPRQLTEADVHRLYVARRYDAINAAREAGELDDLTGTVRYWPPTSGPWTRDDLAAMKRERRHDEIEQAHAAGQLADLITGIDPDAA